MVNGITKNLAEEIFKRRLEYTDIDNDEVFDVCSFQSFLTTMGDAIVAKVDALGEKDVDDLGAELEPLAENHEDCRDAVCRAVLEDLARLAVKWWNEGIERLEKEAVTVNPGKIRLYRVYATDKKEDNEETLYFGSDFKKAVEEARDEHEHFTRGEIKQGRHVVLAYNDFIAENVEELSEKETVDAWFDLSYETRVGKAVWYGQAEI